MQFKLLVAVLVAFGAGLCGNTVAQTYPARPIRIIVPFPAGGTSDILTRLIGAKMTESWGQQVLPDNRPGANGNIGADFVARAAADGYTLVLMDVGNLAISPSLFPKPLPKQRSLPKTTTSRSSAICVSVFHSTTST